ncbi:uncharacterized protein KIAA1671 homolog [Arapaima gigas]
MATQVEVKSGEAGRAASLGGRLRLSPLADFSNKNSVDPPSSTQGVLILPPGPTKPVPGPKPRLTPKPFAVEKNAGVKPILAPKPQAKPRSELTRPGPQKPKLPNTPKPTASPPSATSHPTPTTFKPALNLNVRQAPKPVPAPPSGDLSKTATLDVIGGLGVDTGTPHTKSSQVAQSAEWAGSTEQEETCKRPEGRQRPIVRAKSMGFLSQLGQGSAAKELEKGGDPTVESVVLQRMQLRAVKHRPVSAIFLPVETQPVPHVSTSRWLGRRPLSADLTAKFEPIGLSQQHKADCKENTPEKVVEEGAENNRNMKQDKRAEPLALSGPEHELSLSGPKRTNEQEEDNEGRRSGDGIKRRISLLFDSAPLSPAARSLSPTEVGLHSSGQATLETDIPVGVKQRIKKLTEDIPSSQASPPRPPFKPRPLHPDLTKRFAAEKPEDVSGSPPRQWAWESLRGSSMTEGGAQDKVEEFVDQAAERQEAEAVLENPRDHPNHKFLKQSPESTKGGLKNGQPSEAGALDPCLGRAVQTVRAAMFENVVERHSVKLVDEPTARSWGSLSFRHREVDPTPAPSPVRVEHLFDTVPAVGEKRAMSECIPAAHLEEKAMTLRSRRSGPEALLRIEPTEEQSGPPKGPSMSQGEPHVLRVGALQRWSTVGTDREAYRGVEDELAAERKRQLDMEKEKQRQIELERERLRQIELEKQRQIEMEKERQMQIEMEKEKKRQTEIERERMRQIEVERQRQVKLEKDRQRQVELEKEKTRQLELERERLRQIELEKQRLVEIEEERQREMERQRQIELEKEKQKLIEMEKEMKRQIELERERLRQIELEKKRQLVLEKERQRQAQLEKEWQAKLEKERQWQAELEKERQWQAELEKERQRQAHLEKDRQRQAELEKDRQRQAELEKERQRQAELEKERQRQAQLEKERQRQAELEKERQRQAEDLDKDWQGEAEKERQRIAECTKQVAPEREDAGAPKRLKMLEGEEQLSRPRATYFALTGQMQDFSTHGDLAEGRAASIELSVDDFFVNSGRWDSHPALHRNQTLNVGSHKNVNPFWMGEVEVGTVATVIQEKEKEKDHESQKEKLLELRRHIMAETERQRQREVELEIEMERDMERQVKSEKQKDRQWLQELHRQRQVQMENKQDRAHFTARQPEWEQPRATENRDEHTELLRPQVLDLDSMSLMHRQWTGTPAGDWWKQPTPKPNEPYHMAILDIDSFHSQMDPTPTMAAVPVMDTRGIDLAGVNRTQVHMPKPGDGQETILLRTTGRSAAMCSPAQQDFWKLTEGVTAATPSVHSKLPGSWFTSSSPPKPAPKPSMLPEERLSNSGLTQDKQWPGLPVETGTRNPFTQAEHPKTLITEPQRPGRGTTAPSEHPQWLQEKRPELGGPRGDPNTQTKELSRMRSRSVSRRSTPSENTAEGPLSRMRSRSAHREQGQHNWASLLKKCVTGEDEGRDTDTLVRETDSQYGTWETGLRTEDSLTPATPTSDSNLSSSPRKPTPPHTPSDLNTPDAPTPSSHPEGEPLPFPETATTLLDSSALRSRVQLSKKRSRRTLPSRAARHSATLSMLHEGPGDASQDWMYRDSTEEKPEATNQEDSDVEGHPKATESRPSSSGQQRVALFPGMDPSALQAQLRKRGDSDIQTDGPAPSPSQQSRSPKSPFLPRASRVLPPAGGKENGEESSPQWLKELKSKKRLSQYDNTNT